MELVLPVALGLITPATTSRTPSSSTTPRSSAPRRRAQPVHLMFKRGRRVYLSSRAPADSAPTHIAYDSIVLDGDFNSYVLPLISFI